MTHDLVLIGWFPRPLRGREPDRICRTINEGSYPAGGAGQVLPRRSHKTNNPTTRRPAAPAPPIQIHGDTSAFVSPVGAAGAEAGAAVCVGTWPPALNIFETLLRRGKMDE